MLLLCQIVLNLIMDHFIYSFGHNLEHLIRAFDFNPTAKFMELREKMTPFYPFLFVTGLID